MLHALIVVLTCQLLGEATARALGLPLPGPVLGMVLLLVALVALPRLTDLIRRSRFIMHLLLRTRAGS